MTSSTTEQEFLIDYMKTAAFCKALNNVYEAEVEKRRGQEEPQYEAQKYLEVNFLRKLELDGKKLRSEGQPLKALTDSFYTELISRYMARKLMNSWDLKSKYPNFRKAFTSIFESAFDVAESEHLNLAASKGFYVHPDSKRHPLGMQPYDYMILYSQYQKKAQSKAVQSRSPQLFLIVNPYTLKFGFCYGQYIDPVYVEKVKEDRFVQNKLYRNMAQSPDLKLVLDAKQENVNIRKVMYNENSLNEEIMEYTSSPSGAQFEAKLKMWNKNSHVIRELVVNKETVKSFIKKIEERIQHIVANNSISSDNPVKLKTNYDVKEGYFFEDFFDGVITEEKEYTDSCRQNIVNKLRGPGEPVRETFERLRDFYLKVSEITPVGLNLLRRNKQLILTGVPGSGKTYLAKKEIAPKLIKGDGGLPKILNSDGHSKTNYLEGIVNEDNVDDFVENFMIEHVYFHPSYRYDDFVEGVWPVQKVKIQGDRRRREEVKELDYELMDGNFKRFCKKAGVLERALYGAMLEDRLEENYVWQKFDELIKNFENEFSKEYSEFWGNFWNSVKDYLTKDPRASTKMRELVKVLAEETHEENINKFRKVSEIISESLPKFVYMIDNINRADLSQIFGELMFSFDPDYRGYEGRVKTKYSNLIARNYYLTNKKDDYFFIPSNVYIIGKMNNIESSEEVFNFAMRCRFVWHELGLNMYVFNIMLQDVDISINKADILKEQAKNLNNCLSENSDTFGEFRIGPAYFGQISKYIEVNNDFISAVDILWEYHLKPLISEFLKPRATVERKNKLIDLCQKAFYREKTFLGNAEED